MIFPGLKRLFGVEGVFDLPHQRGTVPGRSGPGEIRCGRCPRRVPPAMRAFELRDQRGDLIGDLPEFFQVVRAMQIQHGADVQQPAGRVAVKRRLDADPRHQLLQPGNIGGQILRAHRRVFDEARGLRIAFAAGEQGEAGFAHGPDQRNFAFGFAGSSGAGRV